MALRIALLALAVYSLQRKVEADLFCYTEMQNCRSGNVTVLRMDPGAAAKQCCVGNSGISYRTSNVEGCMNCVVYGFFAAPSDNKLLNNVSMAEGTQKGLTVYFGLLKGLPPYIRRVDFKADALNKGEGSPQCKLYTPSYPYLFSQANKLSVIMSAGSNNIALEDNSTVKINPQLSSTGDNEFVIPLNVAIFDTNVMTVNFSSNVYYTFKERPTATLSIVRGSVAPAKPLRFNLNLLALDESQQVLGSSLGVLSVLFPTNKAKIDVPIDVSQYNFRNGGFAVRLELDDKSQVSNIDLTGRNLTYVYFNKNITVGFTTSEMNITTGQDIEICVNITQSLPGMDPITMTISAASLSGDKNTFTLRLSESHPISCINIKDTPHTGMMIYRLSSRGTNQPIDITPDILTITQIGKNDSKHKNADDDSEDES